MASLSFPDQVYAVVQRIPPGKVATYGQIARLLGRPRGAREVGWALRDLPDDRDVPWQRVINAQGRVSFPPGSQGAAEQQAMLEAEGIVFRPDGSIDLKAYGWEGLDLGEQYQLRSGDSPGEPGKEQLSLGL